MSIENFKITYSFNDAIVIFREIILIYYILK